MTVFYVRECFLLPLVCEFTVSHRTLMGSLDDNPISTHSISRTGVYLVHDSDLCPWGLFELKKIVYYWTSLQGSHAHGYRCLYLINLIFLIFSQLHICVCIINCPGSDFSILKYIYVCVCVCVCLEMIIFYLKFKHIVSLANTMPCLQQRCLFIYLFFKVMGFGVFGVLPLSQILTTFLKIGNPSIQR